MSCSISNGFSCFSLFQKPDSDLTFEDLSFGNVHHSDDKVSNQLNENSRTKLVSKRSVSDASDKAIVDENQSDDGWMSRVKRRLSHLFFNTEGTKVVQKRDSPPKPVEVNRSQEKSVDLASDLYVPPRRRRHEEDDDEDDDTEDNEIASGDHEVTPDTDPITPITPLPPVKDDKYCEIAFLV